MDSIRSLSWITTQEAADTLNCSIQHLRLLIRKGHLVGTKRGRDWLVERSSVEALGRAKYEAKNAVPERIEQQRSLFIEPEYREVVNVASVPQRSPFRYPGGKSWLIPMARLWLGSLAPKPTLLVEPFAGGGGIGLMAAFEEYAESSLLVELDPDVAAVWRVMLGRNASRLQEQIRSFVCTEDAVRSELSELHVSESRRAFQTVVRNRVSRGGILAPGAGLVKRGEANKGIASRWYPETLADRIEKIHQQRSRIQFREADGLDVLCEQAANANAAFFIDPPYPVAGKRLYRFHDLDHRKLFDRIEALAGPFLATYDHNPEIEALAKHHNFQCRLIPMKSTHHRRKLELLISRNFEWLEGHLVQ